MPNYEVVNYLIRPVEGDDQIELVINASDGSTWEYGIPFSRSSGRYMFEEIDVLEMDFGEEFSEKIASELDDLVAKLTDN
ncbi:MAG: hypothetical protein O7B99_11180 [Planctomycetota bacterium]|nr:hypothetical protein [Planctomycetota bacterium]